MRRTVLLVFALSLIIPIVATGTTTLAGPRVYNAQLHIGTTDTINFSDVPNGKKFIVGTVIMSQASDSTLSAQLSVALSNGSIKNYVRITLPPGESFGQQISNYVVKSGENLRLTTAGGPPGRTIVCTITGKMVNN